VDFSNDVGYSQTLTAVAYHHRNGFGAYYGAQCGPRFMTAWTWSTCYNAWVDLTHIASGCNIWQAQGATNYSGNIYSRSICV